MSNLKLSHVAIAAVFNGDEYPIKKSNCQAFVRECVETAHGAGVSEKIRAGSARLSAQLWKTLGWGFGAGELEQRGGLQEGDVLYKTEGSGGFGHTGIAVRRQGKWQVAENSSSPIGRVRGALGFRSLAQFGAFQVVGRLPSSVSGEAAPIDDQTAAGSVGGASTPTPQLIVALKKGEDIEYHRLQTAYLEDGRFRADSSEIFGVLTGGNKSVEARAFLEQIGAKLYREGNHLNDLATPRMYLFVEV